MYDKAVREIDTVGIPSTGTLLAEDLESLCEQYPNLHTVSYTDPDIRYNPLHSVILLQRLRKVHRDRWDLELSGCFSICSTDPPKKLECPWPGVRWDLGDIRWTATAIISPPSRRSDSYLSWLRDPDKVDARITQFEVMELSVPLRYFTQICRTRANAGQAPITSIRLTTFEAFSIKEFTEFAEAAGRHLSIMSITSDPLVDGDVASISTFDIPELSRLVRTRLKGLRALAMPLKLGMKIDVAAASAGVGIVPEHLLDLSLEIHCLCNLSRAEAMASLYKLLLQLATYFSPDCVVTYTSSRTDSVSDALKRTLKEMLRHLQA
jgi:hypothetical protein